MRGLTRRQARVLMKCTENSVAYLLGHVQSVEDPED